MIGLFLVLLDASLVYGLIFPILQSSLLKMFILLLVTRILLLMSITFMRAYKPWHTQCTLLHMSLVELSVVMELLDITKASGKG